MGQAFSTADWAKLYARAHWRSFPVRPGDKRPVYKNWQDDATTDPALIDQYWNVADRNIGLVCGERFDAWDIEAAYVAPLSEWMYRNGHVLPECPWAQTGRGGIHILTAPTGVDGNRYLYLEGTHIGELKSRGGFIVACPSETEADYQWCHLTARLEVPEPPDWLRGLLERPSALRRTLPTPLASPNDVVTVLGRLGGSIKTAGEGRRNSYLYWAMRRAIEEGVPAQYAIKALREAAIEAGLEADEIEKTIESAVGAESIAA